MAAREGKPLTERERRIWRDGLLTGIELVTEKAEQFRIQVACRGVKVPELESFSDESAFAQLQPKRRRSA